MAEQDYVSRLLDAGISPEDVVAIAIDAATIYDRNRKPWGAISGAIGMMGRQVYEALCRTTDYDPDIDAFLTYRAFTSEALAERIVRTRGAVGSAVNRLIEHGFIDKRREGRRFSVRLAIPTVALTECGEHYTQPSELRTLWHDHNRPLGEIILKLFPR